MNPEEFHRQFDSIDWAPPGVDLDELQARLRELRIKVGDRELTRWVLKYWTLRWPDGGLPPV